MSEGSALYRIFSPEPYGTEALTFRHYGPILRFDHQPGIGENHEPTHDSRRAIYYAAPTLASCLAEVFGDGGYVEPEGYFIARPLLGRPLHLLDLRYEGAMGAGVNSTISKTEDALLSQAWSRFFYERVDLYGEVDGLLYLNAHNDREALALYERCRDALECREQDVIALADDDIRPEIQRIARETHLHYRFD